MARYYTHYWKSATAWDQVGSLLNHTASDAHTMGRVKAGDVVWIVTVIDGRLWTAGRLVVEKSTSQREAERRFGARLWNAKYHVTAIPEHVVQVRLIDIHSLVHDIEFVGGATKLRFDGEMFSAMALVPMRELRLTSAERLQAFWSEAVSQADDIEGMGPPKGVSAEELRRFLPNVEWSEVDIESLDTPSQSHILLNRFNGHIQYERIAWRRTESALVAIADAVSELTYRRSSPRVLLKGRPPSSPSKFARQVVNKIVAEVLEERPGDSLLIERARQTFIWILEDVIWGSYRG